MTKEEFLLDMLDYYTVDPEGRRCNSEAGCYYSPETIGKTTSEGCAIGRKLDREFANRLDEEWDGGISVQDIIKTYPDFPEYMYEFDINFLSECQELHDMPYNWDFDFTGLSTVGKKSVESMIQKFDLDKSKFEKYL